MGLKITRRVGSTLFIESVLRYTKSPGQNLLIVLGRSSLMSLTSGCKQIEWQVMESSVFCFPAASCLFVTNVALRRVVFGQLPSLVRISSALMLAIEESGGDLLFCQFKISN